MSNSESAILLEHLSKQYRIGARLDPYRTLRETIVKGAREPFRRLAAVARGEPAAPPAETIWALRDVSFEIKRGEVVGIIGRNGAGKSTLLKILSRITEPTSGWAKTWGRVGSLLEVGTGFHPELTGRENIYLYGSILGMKRSEIDLNFDKIVSFSGVAPFLDTPVKHYSSGMYVRLAFAVAAHLEPQILIVDEVLAVGDAEFQRKCLAKMEEVSEEGRTVLFVSHNMGLIQSLCRRVILMREGSVYADDTAANGVGAYLRTLEQTASENLLERRDRGGRGRTRLARIEITAGDPLAAASLMTGGSARFAFYVSAVLPGMSCCFTIYDAYGHPVTYFDSAIPGGGDAKDLSKREMFSCEIEELMLTPGRYRINAAIMLDGELEDHLEGASFFEVEQGTLRGRPVPRSAGYVSVFTPHSWRTPV